MRKAGKKIVALLTAVTMVVTGAMLVPKTAKAMSYEKDATIGVEQTGTFDTSNTEDTYRVVVSESGTLNIKVGVNGYVYIYLYNSDGNQLTSDYVSGSSETNITACVEAGTYYIVVKGNGTTYHFTPTFTPSGETYTYTNDSINDIADKDAIPFATTINGFFSYTDSKDFYKIVLPSAGTLNFKYNIKDSTYTTFSLWDKNGNQLGYDCSVYNSGNSGSFDLEAGTYYLKAASGNKGGYYFTASFSSYGETYTYDNSSMDKVTGMDAIPFGSEIRGFLGQNGTGSEWYKIVHPHYGDFSYTVSVNGISSVDFSVWDSNGNQVGTSDHINGTDKTIVYDKQEAGTYYIRAKAGYGASGGYYFTMNDKTYTSIYRLYNKTSGEHIFTTDMNEYNTLPDHGWKQEGRAWNSPVESGTPVYRLYNPNSGDHHYTTDVNEYNTLPSLGWKQEGVAFYSDDNHGMAVYRLFNPNVTIGTHHFTTDSNENSTLPSYGWRQENISWYGMN